MQAWNSVKVISDESVHLGKAGTVLRVEKKAQLNVVVVVLDESGDPENFIASELELL